MRVGLDTNVLVYAEGVNDSERASRVAAIIASWPADDVVIPIQVLGELFRVLTGKARWSAARARLAVQDWRDSYSVVSTTSTVFDAALDLTANHRFSIWDAVIVNAAADAGCRLLLSEDLHDGFVWRGLTIVNPFATEPHPLLRRL